SNFQEAQNSAGSGPIIGIFKQPAHDGDRSAELSRLLWLVSRWRDLCARWKHAAWLGAFRIALHGMWHIGGSHGPFLEPSQERGLFQVRDSRFHQSFLARRAVDGCGRLRPQSLRSKLPYPWRE